MLRVVPKEESDFKDSVIRHILQFAMDEGINWETVCDSKSIEQHSWGIANQLWWIKNQVPQTEFDKMNTREERKKWEGDVKNDS